MPDDWTFANATRSEKLWGPHGYHRYPAKFIPPLAHRLIETYSGPGTLVGDPFLGSATTGIEALRLERTFHGSDVSQVSLLISRAKCIPLDPSKLNTAWLTLRTSLQHIPALGRQTLCTEERAVIKAIDIARASREERLHYWFPLRHRENLACILQQILTEKNEAFRDFFLCGFSNILRRCSIWLSGSIKAQKDLDKVLSDPLEEFRKQMRDMLARNLVYWETLQKEGQDPEKVLERCQLRLEDARYLSHISDTFDLIVTSPPYATCYEYRELHQLTELWLEKYHVFDTKQFKDRWIGSRYLTHHDSENVHYCSPTADKVLSLLTLQATTCDRNYISREIRALRCYFYDMSLVLQECARVTKPMGYTILVVGNSYRRNVNIPTSEVVCELACNVGYTLKHTILRKIPTRVLVSTRDKQSGRFSSVSHSDTIAYPEEYILVFQRLV